MMNPIEEELFKSEHQFLAEEKINSTQDINNSITPTSNINHNNWCKFIFDYATYNAYELNFNKINKRILYELAHTDNKKINNRWVEFSKQQPSIHVRLYETLKQQNTSNTTPHFDSEHLFKFQSIHHEIIYFDKWLLDKTKVEVIIPKISSQWLHYIKQNPNIGYHYSKSISSDALFQKFINYCREKLAFEQQQKIHLEAFNQQILLYLDNFMKELKTQTHYSEKFNQLNLLIKNYFVPQLLEINKHFMYLVEWLNINVIHYYRFSNKCMITTPDYAHVDLYSHIWLSRIESWKENIVEYTQHKRNVILTTYQSSSLHGRPQTISAPIITKKRQPQPSYEPISTKHISVSGLTKYNKCPIIYHCENNLKIHLEDEYDIHSSRGIAIHKILELFWSEFKNHDQLCSLSNSKMEHKIEELINETIANSDSKEYQIDHFKLEKELIFKLIYRWLNFEKTRNYFEVKLIEHPVSLKINNYEIIGRMDRIDYDEHMQTHVLIDYKLSMGTPISQMLQAFPDVQMAVYMLSAPLDIGALLYGLIRTTEFKGIAFDANNFGCKVIKDLPDWKNIIHSNLDKLNLPLHANPFHRNLCRTCHWHTMCLDNCD